MKKLLLAIMVIFLTSPEAFAEEKTEADRWKSSLGLSFVTASGNTDSETLSVSAEAIRKGEVNKLDLSAGIVYGTLEEEESSKYWYSKAKYDHDIYEKTYLFALTTLEGNELAGYHLRFGAFGGPGYRFLEGTHNLSAEIGPGYIFEDRIDDSDRSFFSGRVYSKYLYNITKKATFSQDIEYLIDFDDEDDYRVNAETALNFAITELISFKTSVKIQYVNKPPTEDIDKTDVFTSTSLVFTF